MTQTIRIAPIPTSSGAVRINYIDVPAESSDKGVILPIHGFPQASYQYRHIIAPLTSAGYRVIILDYLAADFHYLITHNLSIKERVHKVGRDIGGTVAYAYASRYSNSVSSIVWGECSLPGTSAYQQDVGVKEQWHFIFQCVPDLPETLVTGREEAYLNFFFDNKCYNTSAIQSDDVAVYLDTYKRPGAMRAAFETYRAFENEKDENIEWLKEHGKCSVPSLVLSGDCFRHTINAEAMAGGVFENIDVVEVRDSAHYVTEENPNDFAEKVLRFIERHDMQ